VGFQNDLQKLTERVELIFNKITPTGHNTHKLLHLSNNESILTNYSIQDLVQDTKNDISSSNNVQSLPNSVMT